MKIDGKIIEKKTFDFYVDEKISMWRRHYFQIDAPTKDKAIQEAMSIFAIAMNDNNVYPEGVEYYEDEDFYDSIEFINPENNNGSATFELYEHETNSELLNNRI